MRTTPLMLSLAAAAVLSACASMGESQPRVAAASPSKLATGDALSSQAGAAWPANHWWTALGDAQLDGLIDEALAGSPSLDAARARIDRARGFAGLAASLDRPQLAVNAEAQAVHFQENDIFPPPLAGNTRGTGRVALDGGWELDFFGKHRAELDAALSQVRAAGYEQQGVALALSSRITRAYVQLDHEYATLDVIDTTLMQRLRVVELNRQRMLAGLDPASESKVANAGVANTRLEREAVLERIALLQDALGALVGAGPDRGRSLRRPQLASLGAAGIPASLPAELVARRPDIAAQQARLDAGLRHIDVAQAAFYPNVDLNAFAGFQAIGLGDLLSRGSATYGVGPALHLPIFDGGRLRANLRVSEAEFNAAVAQYNILLVDAFREVADAAASQQAIARQQAQQQVATADVDQAFHLAEQRYKQGLGNQLAVLAAQDRQLALQRVKVDLAARQRLAWIDLNRALGGGFTAPDTVAAR